jgi:hypothetical protein
MISQDQLEIAQHLEEIRYELCSIQNHAIYLSNLYGDKNFLRSLIEEAFIATTRIISIENYRFYAQMDIHFKELRGASHIYHQSILDSFEAIYVSHRKLIGQDF